MATCGRCRATNVTVQHVRECYSTGTMTSATVITTPNGGVALPPPSERQIETIDALFRTRRIDEIPGPLLLAHKEGRLTGSRTGTASALITALMDAPHALREAGEEDALKRANAVPAGRYAIERNGVLRFYAVEEGRGKWKGFTFVKVQASDELHPVKNSQERIAILNQIAEDTQGAMERYGKELGVCGAAGCGRTLTNEESRARGIGPICAGKMGW